VLALITNNLITYDRYDGSESINVTTIVYHSIRLKLTLAGK